MNILIRCDSSNIIGTGHVMRCLNMCEYYPENKYTFVCKNYPSNISERIVNANHSLILLDYSIEPKLNEYKTWIGDTDEDESKKMVDIISKNKFDEIFIDHYGYDEIIEKELSKYNDKIIVLTDIFEFKHYCNELICFSSDDLNILKNLCIKENTIIKYGMEYVIVNKKFREFKKYQDKKEIKKVTVMLGGTDPLNFTLYVLSELNDLFEKNHIQVNIIIGKLNINLESINNFIRTKNFYKIKNDLSYDELIQEYLNTDLCIGSLSVTAYERLFMNVRQICLKIVDNQNIQQLNEFNICTKNTLKDKFIAMLKI